MKKLLKQLLWLCFVPLIMNGQQRSENRILSLVKLELESEFSIEKIKALQLKVNDFNQSKKSTIEHYYFRQTMNGVQIFGTESSLHLKPNGEVFKFNNRLTNKTASISNLTPTLNPVQAVKKAAKQLGYSNIGNLTVLEHSQLKDRSQKISKGTLSRRDIPVKLVYEMSDHDLVLAWDLSIYETQNEEWWSIRVDAQSGEIIAKDSWMTQCGFGHENKTHTCSNHPKDHMHTNIEESPLEEKTNSVGGYRVFRLPLANPGEGGRTLINNPDNATASPYGWHDTNGALGAEYNYTRGNNVHAFDAGNNAGYSPNGGGGLVFDFPLNLNQDPNFYEAAAITNLFYINNVAHDVLYHYGFDEASGNFQQNNYGNGGQASDYVDARSQIGLVCNAFFGTPSDGFRPSMSMYICNGRDGDFSNSVILHEYGHGLSNRLTGGPSAANCLGNAEQMGEGWSDYLGLMLTMKASHLGTTSRPMGEWLFNNPAGIRPHPYTTNMSVNPHTYASSFTGTSQPHGIGSVWCAMIWEMTWSLIDQYGFDANFYTGSGGNNIALQLVVEGLKLQPCSPGFVDGRNAILAADQALYGGVHQCLIWTAFAKRGLGSSANQGSSQNRSDGNQAFNIPASCVNACATNLNLTGTATGTAVYKAQNNITSTQTVSPTADVSYKAGTRVRLVPGFSALNGAQFHGKIEGCSNFNTTNDGILSKQNGADGTGQQTAVLVNKNNMSSSLTIVPHPLQSSIGLAFQLLQNASVNLSIVDVNGRTIEQLTEGNLKQGHQEFVWQAKGQTPGIYLAKLICGQEVQTVKVVLSK